LILVPGLFYFNLDTNQFDNGGISVENRKVYAYLINENLIYKNCPVILANSVELQGMTAKTPQEAATLHKIKLNDEVKEVLPKMNDKKKGR